MAVKVRFNLAAYRQIRRSQPVESFVGATARRIAAACGGDEAGYFAQTSLGTTRARGVVIAGTYEARKDNAVNNTLVRSLDAGRRGGGA